MKTLRTACRVTDLAASRRFYGGRLVGSMALAYEARLTMLRLPGEPVVTLELAHQPSPGPVDVGTGFRHLVVQVDDLAACVARFSSGGLWPGPVSFPAGPPGPRTACLAALLGLGAVVAGQIGLHRKVVHLVRWLPVCGVRRSANHAAGLG